MDDLSFATHPPETKSVGKAASNKSAQRPKSAWIRTKQLLTCSSCRGNAAESDSEAYGCPVQTIVDVPLCSGDKNIEVAGQVAPAVVEPRKEASGGCTGLRDSLDEIELDRMDFSTLADNGVQEWVPNTRSGRRELVAAAVSKTFGTAVVGENEVVIDILETPFQEHVGATIIEQSVQVIESDGGEIDDNRLNSVHDIENVANDAVGDRMARQAVLIDMESQKIPIVSELKCVLCEDVAKDGEMRGDLLEQSFVKTGEENAEKKEIEEVGVLSQIREPESNSTDVPTEEQDIESTEVPVVDTDAPEMEVPAKRLAVPRRYVLGTGEAHVLPDVEDTVVATEGATMDAGEGPIQEFLQGVISEQELISRRMEVVNGLLARECDAKEVINASLLAMLVDEIAPGGSESYAGLPSVEALVETVRVNEGLHDAIPVAASVCDLASLEKVPQIPEDEDTAWKSLETDRREEVDAEACGQTHADIQSENQSEVRYNTFTSGNSEVGSEGTWQGLANEAGDSQSVGCLPSSALVVENREDTLDDVDLVEPGEPAELTEEVVEERPAVVQEFTDESLSDVDEVARMNFYYEDQVEYLPANLPPMASTEVLEGNAEMERGACEIRPEGELTSLDDIIYSEDSIPREHPEEVPLVVLCDYNCEVVAEGIQATSKKRRNAITAEAVSSTLLYVNVDSEACLARGQGRNPRPSQEFLEEVAHEVIDPMLADAVRAVEHDMQRASTPSVADLTAASLECLRSPGDEFHTLFTAAEASETKLSDLEKASLGFLQSTASVNDLDTLLTALEATESTLAGLEEASLECLQTAPTNEVLNNLATSLEATESTLETLQSTSTTTSLACVPSTSSIHGVDKLLSSLKISDSLATLEADAVQPLSTGNETSTTSLSTDQTADGVTPTTASLVELSMKPSLMDLKPTASLLGLASSSDDSIADAMATSTEEGGVGSMAVASTSAEWPDQGKEQHRVARNNNRRNKKRNKRGKK